MPDAPSTIFRLLKRGQSVTKWEFAQPLVITGATKVPAGWLLTVEGASAKLELYDHDMPCWEPGLDA